MPFPFLISRGADYICGMIFSRYNKLSKRPDKRAGFSLLEILVAMTILAVIIVLCGMVFHQSSLAWQSGRRRAGGNMALRALIGLMQREMSQAVDARQFGLENRFSANEAAFVILAQGVESAERRSPRRITYSNSGGVIRRDEQALRYASGLWQPVPSADGPAPLNASQPFAEFAFLPVWEQSEEELPMFVEIEAAFSHQGGVSAARVWSSGPNRENEYGEEDDIRSW